MVNLDGALNRMRKDIEKGTYTFDFGNKLDVETYCQRNNISSELAINWFINKYERMYLDGYRSSIMMSRVLTRLQNLYNISEREMSYVYDTLNLDVENNSYIKAVSHCEKMKSGEIKIAYKGWLKPDEVKRKYDELGSYQAVAKHFNVSIGTVRNRLKEIK